MANDGLLVHEDANTPGGLLVHLDATLLALTQSAVKTANYTAQSREIVLLDTSNGSFTVTGPVSGAPFGMRWKAGTAAPIIAAPAGFTINGLASVTPQLRPALSSGELIIWQAFGTDYQAVSGSKPQAALDARSLNPSGAVINWIGDSIAPPQQTSPGFGPKGVGVALPSADFMAWAHLLSNGRVLYGKMAGITGQTTALVLPRIDTDALSMGGNFCGITLGTNDATAGVSPAQFATNMKALCAAIVARGQIPILTTLAPDPAQSTLIDKYRRFIIAYAADNGWPLVDFYSKLVDPASATNAYLSTYDLGDGYHPNPLGKKIMGQALVDALTPYLPPWNGPVQTSNGNANANLLPNSQFATDTNADGVPDGWAKVGPGTISLVTDALVNGKAMRFVDSSGSSGVVSSYMTGTFGGHRIAFTGLIKNPGAASGTGVTFYLSMGSGVLAVMNGWTEPFAGWQRFYLEAVAPAGTTNLGLVMVSGAGVTGVDVSLAQLGVFDLTACGI